jgi:hypothetical protein
MLTTTVTIRQDSATSLLVSATQNSDLLPIVIRRACRSASREVSLLSEATFSATEPGMNINLEQTVDVDGLVHFLATEIPWIWQQLSGTEANVEVAP